VTLTLLRVPPAQLDAGDSLHYTEPVPSDLSGWTGSAYLSTGGAAPVAATTVTSVNDTFEVYFSAAATAALAAGQYTLVVYATSGADRYEVARHPVTIRQNLATGTATAHHAVKTLALVEAAIYNRLNGNTDGGVEQYAVNGIQIQKLSMKDLQALRVKYAAEVARLNNPTAPIGAVKIVFGKSSANPVDFRQRYAP
jgi:hypothetical protein